MYKPLVALVVMVYVEATVAVTMYLTIMSNATAQRTLAWIYVKRQMASLMMLFCTVCLMKFIHC